MDRLTRRRFIGVGAAALGCGAVAALADPLETALRASARESLPQRPNVVLIILDTLRADKLGCYGHPEEVSPGLDKLAADGVRFERVISQCPWTRPSCGSFLTSRHPRALGLYREKNEILPDGVELLSVLLQRAGYTTLGMTANPNLNKLFNFHQGFDHYEDSNVVFSWMPVSRDTVKRGAKYGLPKAVDMFGRALDWAKGKGDKPGYIQINAMEIHEWAATNSVIRPEYAGMFKGVREIYPQYLHTVRQLTDDTTKFVHELAALPGWENTFFVFVSDHGEGLDEHRGLPHSRFHGWMLYESQVVVPWIIYHPAWRPAVNVVDQDVRLLEVMPTILELAGLPRAEQAEGVSMAPAILGEGPVDLPRYFVTETKWRDANKLGCYAANWKFFDNKVAPRGYPRRELQKKGGGERGTATDMLAKEPSIAIELQSFLTQWELDNPLATPTAPRRELSAEEKEQLEAVGYIQ